jgi:hypothetical protein
LLSILGRRALALTAASLSSSPACVLCHELLDFRLVLVIGRWRKDVVDGSSSAFSGEVLLEELRNLVLHAL